MVTSYISDLFDFFLAAGKTDLSNQSSIKPLEIGDLVELTLPARGFAKGTRGEVQTIGGEGDFGESQGDMRLKIGAQEGVLVHSHGVEKVTTKKEDEVGPNTAAVLKKGSEKEAAAALVGLQASPAQKKEVDDKSEKELPGDESKLMTEVDKEKAAARDTLRLMQSPSGKDTVHYTDEKRINLDPFKNIDFDKTSVDDIDLHFLDEDNDAVPLSLKASIYTAVEYASFHQNLEPTRAFVARNQDEQEIL